MQKILGPHPLMCMHFRTPHVCSRLQLKQVVSVSSGHSRAAAEWPLEAHDPRRGRLARPGAQARGGEGGAERRSPAPGVPALGGRMGLQGPRAWRRLPGLAQGGGSQVRHAAEGGGAEEGGTSEVIDVEAPPLELADCTRRSGRRAPTRRSIRRQPASAAAACSQRAERGGASSSWRRRTTRRWTPKSSPRSTPQGRGTSSRARRHGRR